jgi:hypothetical protein
VAHFYSGKVDQFFSVANREVSRQTLESKDRIHQAALAAAEWARYGKVETIRGDPREHLLDRALSDLFPASRTMEHRRLRDRANLELESIVATNCFACDINWFWS